jgi:hypothetical protein
MSISVRDFWKLAVQSRAVSLDEARTLYATFSRTRGAKHANSVTVAEWLIASGVLSRHQAKQLLAGQAAPFVYGDSKKEPPPFEFDTPSASPITDFMPMLDTSAPYVKKKTRNTTWFVFGAVGSIGLIALAILVLFGSHKEEATKATKIEAADVGEVAPTPAAPIEAVEKAEPGKLLEPTDSPATEMADDGKTLWTSPTHGPPVDLRYLASGAQMFLVVRPASLLSTEEGEKIFDALGPRGIAAREFLKVAIGIDNMTDIERLLVAFYPTDGAQPQMAMVVTLRDAVAKDKLLQAWHNPKEAGKQKMFYQGGPWAYYIPAAANGRIFAVAPPHLMTEMLEMDGPPVLRKEMEKLLRDTDETRHVTLLVAPNFLFTDGQKILSGDLAKLKAPLLAYLGEGVLAAELSFHLSGDNFFGEMRIYGALDRSAYQLAEIYRTRLSELPASVEEYLSKLNRQEYSRLILARMPRMIGELAAYTRIGDENKHAVLRYYLPAAAAHNLTLATELALSKEAGGEPVAAMAGLKRPTTIATALKQKISLSFPRNTLEKCLEMLGDEIEAPVHIEGKDLQLEGITKNQSFGLDERDKPADEILRTVMLKANPDGKLVYVIRPLKPGGKDVVFITTRAAATKRGDNLPRELEQILPGK